MPDGNREFIVPPVAEPSKALLWNNVASLMRKRYGRENLNQLARDAKIGPATASRIKEMKTSVGLDVIDRIAGVFGLVAWQLLVPELDPTNIPVVMITAEERRFYDKIRRVEAVLKEPAYDEKIRSRS